MQIYLLLTENCNLACSFCIRGNKKNIYLDKNTLEEVLKSNDFSKYSLMLTGGEPTLHPHLNNIIELAIDKFKFICINTNGINNQWINNLRDKDKVHVQISIDGTRETHNKIRSNKKFDVLARIEKTIQRLEDMCISYNISTTVSKDNFTDMGNLMSYLTKFKKMKFWKLSSQLPFGCGKLKTTIDTTSWNNLVDFLLENCTIPMHIKRIFDFNLLDKVKEQNFVVNPIQNCGSGKTKFYIYPDFTVYPCTCLINFPIGNISTHSLQSIISSNRNIPFFNYKVEQKSICASCNYLFLCNGGCIGMSYHFFNKLGMGDYRCPIIQEKLHISSLT